jgi:DNA-binding IclR family transcriptional regulator
VATPRNQSVLKAFALLKSFRQADEWLTSSDLSRRARLPEASGYRLIQTLEEVGAVVRGPRGRYRLGMLMVSLARNVPCGEVLREASHDILSILSVRLDMTVHMGVLENSMVTYIAKVTTPNSFQTHARVGSQLEPYCSGLGKVLLSALPDDALENILSEGDLVALTPHTITDAELLRAQLADVREQGFALDNRENQLDMGCLAVPILDPEGRTIAALSATYNAAHMDGERQKHVFAMVDAAAAAIGRKLYPVFELAADEVSEDA